MRYGRGTGAWTWRRGDERHLRERGLLEQFFVPVGPKDKGAALQIWLSGENGIDALCGPSAKFRAYQEDPGMSYA